MSLVRVNASNLKNDYVEYVRVATEIVKRGRKIDIKHDCPIDIHEDEFYVSTGDVTIHEPSFGSAAYIIVLKKGHKLNAPKGKGHINVCDENTYKADQIRDYLNIDLQKGTIDESLSDKARKNKKGGNHNQPYDPGEGLIDSVTGLDLGI